MKKLSTITIILALLCGLFVITPKADGVDPEETTTAEVVEATLEGEPEEIIEKEEILEETSEDEEEIIEEEAVEEETDNQLDDPSYFEVFLGEDEVFEYYAVYDKDFNPNGGLCLNQYCKHCHYGDIEETTSEEINNRFGVNICK